MGTEQNIRSLYQSKGVVEKRGDKAKEESGTEGKDTTKKGGKKDIPQRRGRRLRSSSSTHFA